VAEWHWEAITDDLLDGLPPDALRMVEQLGKELAVRESSLTPPNISRKDLEESPDLGLYRGGRCWVRTNVG
jgi:hypothetical protein